MGRPTIPGSSSVGGEGTWRLGALGHSVPGGRVWGAGALTVLEGEAKYGREMEKERRNGHREIYHT